MGWGRRGLAAAGIAALLASVAAHARDAKVGVTAAVNPQAVGTPPAQASRTLSIGLDMIRNERIVTGPLGKTQLLFVDGSALTIGPNAEVVLDEFVYDANTGTGKLAMTTGKGVLRIVGGKLSKTEAIEVRTPTATLGIRGGIALIGPTGFAFLFGDKLTVTGTSGPSAGQTVEIVRRGTMLPLGPNGRFLPLQPVTSAMLSDLLGGLEGDQGKTAGSNDPPTDQRFAASGLDQLGSALPPEVIGAEPAAGGDTASKVPATLPDDRTTTAASQLRDQRPAPQGSTTTTVTGPTLMLTGSLTGRYKSTPGTGSAAGTAGDGTATFDRAFGGAGLSSTLFQAQPGGQLFSAPVSPTGGFLSYSASEATSPFGPVSGTSFVSPNRDFAFFESVETNFSNERSFLFAGLPTPAAAIPTSGFAAYDIRRDFVGDSNIPFIPAALGGNLTGTVSPAYLAFTAPGGGLRQFLQGSVAIVGAGETQSSAVSILVGGLGNGGPLVLDGSMRGSSRLSGNGAYFFAGAAGFATDLSGNGTFGANGPDYFVLESNGAEGRGVTSSSPTLASGGYFPNNVASRAPAGDAGANRTPGTFQGFAAGLTETTPLIGGASALRPLTTVIGPGSPAFTLLVGDPANSVGLTFQVQTPDNAAYALPFGGNNLQNNNAFIDDRRFAGREGDGGQVDFEGDFAALQNMRLYFVSGGLADISGLLPQGVTACECAFMRWGFWGGDFVNPLNGVRERIHLGQWVAGELNDHVTIANLSGTATYAGHAIADIVNNGRAYKAAGAFGLTYDFGARTGGAFINNLDGINYAGGVSATSGSEHLPQGTVSGGAGISGNLNLAFYGNGPSNPAAGVGGQFNLANGAATYRAVGIVLGQKVP